MDINPLKRTCGKFLHGCKYCSNKVVDNSFFCKKHKKTLYPVNKFYLVHSIENAEHLYKIMNDKELRSSSITKKGNYSVLLDKIFLSLLSPDDRIILGNDILKDIGIFSTHLIFRADLILEHNVHFNTHWLFGDTFYGDDFKYQTYEYVKEYGLKENLNRWSNILQSRYGLIFYPHHISPNEIVINSERVSLNHLTNIFFPRNAYEDIVCHFSCYDDSYAFTYDIELALNLYVHKHFPDLQFCYDSRNGFMANYFYYNIYKPWLSYNPKPNQKCIRYYNKIKKYEDIQDEDLIHLIKEKIQS